MLVVIPRQAKRLVRALLPVALSLIALSPGCGDNVYVTCTPTAQDGGTPLVSAPPQRPPQPPETDAAMTPARMDSGPGAPRGCPPESSRRIEVVTGEIAEDTVWDCDAMYLLGGYVVVKNYATLTIKPGVIVRGDGTSALVVTRDGKIDAQGEPARPIVFTSVGAPGMRAPGGWQGLVLLGKARLNQPVADREFEGLPTSNADYRYGGTDDAHDCGTLKYVRIEFAGHELQPNKELNNLSVAGCGSDTDLDYIQLHLGKDDGVEFFGGTASAKHLVITGADDDGIDWDEGWRGNLQFAVVQQHDLSGAGDSNGIEASNRAGVPDAMPIASPRIYNVTLIGDRDSYNKVRALLLKDGTYGELKNVLAMGFASMAIDIESKASADALVAEPAHLSITNSMFFQIGPSSTDYFPGPDMEDNAADDGLSEAIFFARPDSANRFGMDPLLPRPYDLREPGWVPPASSPAASGGAEPPADSFFDRTASYVGAFAPGGADWTQGWTAYPEN
jgi:hypothetical protein